jgi:hypothetical protein
LSIAPYPSDPSEFDPRKVYYLIFADDLVLLSGDLEELERCTNSLDEALNDVGMKINSGKCKWLAYLPRNINFQSVIVPSCFEIHHAGVLIENVEEFKYLGFLTSFDLSHKRHVHGRIVLLSLAARLTGRLLRSLEITNFRSLRAYFYSLVGSQLYSLSVISFPELDYDRAVKIFLQECFNLPPSFPMTIAKFFVAVDDLMLQAFNARANFFQRVLQGANSDASLGAMNMDRGWLYREDLGWNADFRRFMGDSLDFSSIDFSSPSAVDEARSDLRHALSVRRTQRFASSSSAFVIQIFPDLTIPMSFYQHLSTLPHESVRIILIFFANMFQFTYFRSFNQNCPFCPGNLSSTHLFDCPGSIRNPLCDWPQFISDFQTENFQRALDRLFLILQRWVMLTNRFQPSLAAHVEEYFVQTDFPNRGTDSSPLQHYTSISM